MTRSKVSRADKEKMRQEKLKLFETYIEEAIKRGVKYKFSGNNTEYGLFLLAERNVFKKIKEADHGKRRQEIQP